MLATAIVTLIVWVGIEALDRLDISPAAAGSVAPILAVPILLMFCVGVWAWVRRHQAFIHRGEAWAERHHLIHRHAPS